MPTRSELLNKANETFPAHWMLLCEADRNHADLIFADVISVEFTLDQDEGDLSFHRISLGMRSEGYKFFKMTGYLWESTWMFSDSPTEKLRTFAKYFADYFVKDILGHRELKIQDWNNLPSS